MTNLPHCISKIIKSYTIFKPKNKKELHKALSYISESGDISNWDVHQVTDMNSDSCFLDETLE